MSENTFSGMSKRDLLSLIGKTAGASAMYMAMSSLGVAEASPFKAPIKLDGNPKGASILILGAGMAGLVAAFELRKAGYKVQVLEYNNRVGGRSWTLRGGDRYTELGGAVQDVQFAPGNYINPGPWRVPFHHSGLIHYCLELGVALEPFNQVNYNAYVHNTKAFGGKPQRYQHIAMDYKGHVAELLAKAVSQKALGDSVSKEDGEILLESLRSWGALDKSLRYVTGEESSKQRGWLKNPGGGLTAKPIPSEPIGLSEILQSQLWRSLATGFDVDFQTTLFQPVGGMDMIPKALGREVGDLVKFNAKVVAIQQDPKGVVVTYEDTKTGARSQASADYCLCTIPLSILSQIDMNVSAPMAAAISAVPYEASIKIGLEFKRRFWEQDEAIFGGISYTDLPILSIGYPNTGYGSRGPGVLLGAYNFGAYAYEFTSMPPAERIARALEFGAQIHPQYTAEFSNGVAVGWHRVPWIQGCFGSWTDDARKEHFENLCQIDGRILLAGEHASYIPAWQEGAITSSLDAISRLHKRVVGA